MARVGPPEREHAARSSRLASDGRVVTEHTTRARSLSLALLSRKESCRKCGDRISLMLVSYMVSYRVPGSSFAAEPANATTRSQDDQDVHRPTHEQPHGIAAMVSIAWTACGYMYGALLMRCRPADPTVANRNPGSSKG